MNDNLVSALNLMAVILLLFPLLRLVRYAGSQILPLQRNDRRIQLQKTSSPPDIYYIILDSYARSDVLAKEFDYDNSDFLEALRQLGFYVAGCSQSNYAATALSLGSSLNFDYLQDLSSVFRPGEVDLIYSFKLLDSTALRNSLTRSGYKTIAFASGFYWLEWRNADEFLAPVGGSVTEFETVVLLSSYARILDDLGKLNIEEFYNNHFRERTRFVLDDFDKITGIPGPKLVFVHIVPPHMPFVFDADGRSVDPAQVDARKGYSNGAKFISKAILPHLQRLIQESSDPPVIILQGDHGPIGYTPETQMKILNAYYLPGHTGELYPSISPVNTFRVVLNSYFDAGLPLLDDISYYSDITSSYNFKVITQTCP